MTSARPRHRYAVQEAPPASVGLGLLLVISVAALTISGVHSTGGGGFSEHGVSYGPGMRNADAMNEQDLWGIYLSIIGNLLLSLSPLLMLPLAGLLLVGFRWLRPVYAVLALLNLPMMVIGFAGIPLAAAAGCVFTLASVALLFLPSANAWFRAQSARNINESKRQT